MSRISLPRGATSILAGILVATAFAPSVIAAEPKTGPDVPPPQGVYCDALPAVLPAAFTCYASLTVEVTDPTGAMTVFVTDATGATTVQKVKGGETISPMLNPGVSDKWHWSRSGSSTRTLASRPPVVPLLASERRRR